jgi:hypothetical protein
VRCAGEFVALQGGSVDLGAYHGVVYYTETEDGYRVVTTITAEDGTPYVSWRPTLKASNS